MNVPELGKLLEADEPHDAIHMAVASVVAGMSLSPGEHVGLMYDGDYKTVGSTTKPIGIVDPFLKDVVGVGQRFWLMLYPNTITGLRHEWAHPAFGITVEIGLHSQYYISKFASSIGHDYESLMAAADKWVGTGEYTYDNSQMYMDASSEDWDRFWAHYERIRKVLVRNKQEVFACSC